MTCSLCRTHQQAVGAREATAHARRGFLQKLEPGDFCIEMVFFLFSLLR
jgi:hypothetical protein